MPEYDVAVVGASLAGSTAATLLARQGAKVALLERSPKADHYKTACTHFITATATPTLERLGLTERIEAAGGISNSADIWTRYGWSRPEVVAGDLNHGYDIRREKLDPMLREVARRTDGVDYLGGATVVDLLRDPAGRPCGVRTKDREVTAKVVVGADGRSSTVAKLAAVPARVRPNARFGYFAYWEDLPLETGMRSQLWFLDPDCAYAFPNDDGLTLIAVMPHKDRLPEFREDLEGAYMRMATSVPDGPDYSRARRVSKFVGRMDMSNQRRRAAVPGVAFVGDAAQASDPVWGVGCGWALTTGEWLADELAGALVSGGDVDAALERYHRRHRRELAGHHFMLSDYAKGRGFTPVEKLLFRSAPTNPRVARAMHQLGNREKRPSEVLTPRLLADAAWTVVRRRPTPADAAPPVRPTTAVAA